MVKKIILCSFLLLQGFQGEAKSNSKISNNELTAEKLKNILNNSYKKEQSAAERFKASRINTDNLTVISEKELRYRLPNNSYVAGMLLPNGQLSPAIRTRFGIKPACVTTDYELVLGKWNNQNNSVICKLEKTSLSLLDLTNFQQKQPVRSSKYSNNDISIKKNDASKIKKKNSINSIAEDTNETNKQELKKSSKYTHNTSPKKGKKQNKLNKLNKPNEYVYTPPPRNNTQTSSHAGVLLSDNKKFGIPMGSWIEAELLRNVTSAENGQIEFLLTENVIGKHKVLEADTTLFANKGFNRANKRLEALTTTAIMPSGLEIRIKALVYSSDKSAGLSGTIIRDRQGEFLAAGTQTVINTAASTISGVSAAGQAATDLAGQLLNNEKNHAPKTPNATIRVSKQKVWLKLTESI